MPDAAQSFGGSNNLRFSRKNPFDYFLFDTNNRNLYALELKTVDKKSISFERIEDDKGEIHHHQIQGLAEYDKYENTICGFVIEFRPIQTTVFISVSAFLKMLECNPKKSFAVADLEQYEIDHFFIGQTQKRTHFSYDIGSFLEQTKSLGKKPAKENES